MQILLEDAITCGRHGVLGSLLAVFAKHCTQPQSVEDLLHCAICHGREECFQCLINYYGPAIDMRAIRSAILKEGTDAMLRIVMEIDNGLDDSTFPEAIALVQKRPGGDLTMIEALLEQGHRHVGKEIFIDQVTDLLKFTVDNNEPKVVRALIAARPDFEQRTLAGGTRTHFFHAVFQGYEEVSASLIEAKADLRAKEEDIYAWEPIHAAIENVNLLRMLANAGANLEARTASNYTPLILAVKWNKEASVAELLKHQPDLNRMAGESLLTLAAATGNHRVAFLLLDAGIDPCHQEVMAANAISLHRCVAANNVMLLQRLLLYNLPIETKDNSDRTPLNFIEPQTDIAILRLLLNCRAFVNAIDSLHETPLTRMVLSNELQKAELLMSRGADPDIRNSRGRTTLDIASCQGTLEIIKMLISRGAKLDESHHETSFQVACRRREEKSAELTYLLEVNEAVAHQRSQRWGNNLSTACLTADMEIIKALIARGVDANEQDIIGRRPIHFSLYRTVELVRYLREQRAELFEEDSLQRNVLHFAVASGRLDLVQYVLKEKPDRRVRVVRASRVIGGFPCAVFQ